MQFSKSKIFLFFCLSFIFGIFAESIIKFSLSVRLGILILGVILISMFWGRKKAAVVVGFCILVVAGGAWRRLAAENKENFLEKFNDKEKIVLTGIIIDEPDVRADNIKYKVEILDPANGKILLTAKKYPAFDYGDKIQISGKLKTPFVSDDFDYKSYLSKDDIYSVVYYPEMKLLESGNGNWLKAKLFWLKNKMENSIGQILKEPQAAFLAGLLLGEKRGLPDDLTENFKITGTAHIIALSGYNITIIATALMALFTFFMVRRSVSFWAAVAVISFFVLMTGAAASVVRAAIMGILVLVARYNGRLYSARNALIFAGAIMVYLNPKILVFDLGFQLSFAASLGLIYLPSVLEKFSERKTQNEQESEKEKDFLGIKGILISTLSAQLAVLPLMAVNFGQLSLVSPLANLLVLPFIPLTMLFGFISVLAGIFWLALGQVFGWLAWIFLTYEIKIIALAAKIPFASVNFKWNWIAGGVYYIVLGFVVWKFGERNKLNQLAKQH